MEGLNINHDNEPEMVDGLSVPEGMTVEEFKQKRDAALEVADASGAGVMAEMPGGTMVAAEDLEQKDLENMNEGYQQSNN